MKPGVFFALAFAIGGVLYYWGRHDLAQRAEASQKDWFTDIDLAAQAAKKSHKLMLVSFEAKWCGPCQMYKTQVFGSPNFQMDAQRFVLVAVDVDEHPAVARSYRVNEIPDIRFLTADGRELGRLVGYSGEMGLAAEMIRAASKAR